MQLLHIFPYRPSSLEVDSSDILAQGTRRYAAKCRCRLPQLSLKVLWLPRSSIERLLRPVGIHIPGWRGCKSKTGSSKLSLDGRHGLYITKKKRFLSITNDHRQATATKKDLEALPTPEHITLLLKNHKQTVLLSVMPTTPFAEIRSLLLAALQSRNITSIDGVPLPDEPEEIEFGVLRNKRNPAEGWVPLDVKEMEVGDARGGKRKVGGKQSVLNESPAGASLGDGSMLAFRFRTQGEKSVLSEGPAGVSLGEESMLAFRYRTPMKEDASEEDADMEIEDDPGWNVILPSYDDEE